MRAVGNAGQKEVETSDEHKTVMLLATKNWTSIEAFGNAEFSTEIGTREDNVGKNY